MGLFGTKFHEIFQHGEKIKTVKSFFLQRLESQTLIKMSMEETVDANAVDSQISYEVAVKYWSSVPATVDGVLGGFGETTPVPKADVAGSSGFVRRLKPSMAVASGQIAYGLDIGAG